MRSGEHHGPGRMADGAFVLFGLGVITTIVVTTWMIAKTIIHF
jgi:hypothetical protein